MKNFEYETISVRMPQPVREELRLLAELEERRPSDLVRRLIRQAARERGLAVDRPHSREREVEYAR